MSDGIVWDLIVTFPFARFSPSPGGRRRAQLAAVLGHSLSGAPLGIPSNPSVEEPEECPKSIPILELF